MDQSAEVLPRVIFLNQSAVLIAAKKNNIKYKQHQARLIELMSKGVTILICPDCMKTYGVTEADLIDGIQMGQRHN
jgi:intracellular sulfur oxidation DsrE/DsrF family protein